MNKVYILLGEYHYEGYDVIGVFSSEEKANDYLNKALREKKLHFDDYDIREDEIDELS